MAHRDEESTLGADLPPLDFPGGQEDPASATWHGSVPQAGLPSISAPP